MKRSEQPIPAAETGKVRGDYAGSRSYRAVSVKGPMYTDGAKLGGTGSTRPSNRTASTSLITGTTKAPTLKTEAVGNSRKPKTRAALAFYGEK